IEQMKIAIDKTRIGIEALMKQSKPGMKEYQLEAHYDFAIKTEGVKKTSFHTIAASGANATILHYGENNCEMQDGDLILFDLGCEWNNYCSDISRTFPVNGKFSDRQKAVYQVVLDTQMAIVEMLKPGLDMAEVNAKARKMLADGCKTLGLIENDEDLVKYYYHGIGHYLGLDTHDVGGRGGVLKPGMVITVEPGLYIAEESIGIRIEDDVLITEDGHINLSKDIIKSVEEIEAFMAK
ncbi:MAG: M24B family metallopeptidase, partial [Turicibacter sp.]